MIWKMRLRRLIKIVKDKREYALYKGDNLLAIGTIPAIANKVNVQERTIYFYNTDAYKRKLEKRNNARSYK